MKIFYKFIFVLTSLFISCFAFSYPVMALEQCNFEYLAEELPLISEFSTDVTSEVFTNEESLEVFQRVLPNIKNVYGREEPRINILTGYSELFPNWSGKSKLQVIKHFENMGKLAKQDKERKGNIFNYTLFYEHPFGAKFEHEYMDGGHEFIDKGIDILATPNCFYSLKISARKDNLNAVEWNFVDNQIEEVRNIISNKEDIIILSKKREIFDMAIFFNNLTHIMLAVALATVFFFVHRRFFNVVVTKVIIIYFSFMVFTMLLMLIFQYIANFSSFLNVYETGYDNMAYAPLFLLVGVLNVIALIKRTPKYILVTMSFMIALQITAFLSETFGFIQIFSTGRIILVVATVLVFISISQKRESKIKESRKLSKSTEVVIMVKKKWYTFLGSTISMILGILSLMGGIGQIGRGESGGRGFLVGFCIIIGTTAYRSAKKRKLGLVKSSTIRKTIELNLVIIMLVVVFLQKNLAWHIQNEPISFIVVLWALVAYLIISLKKPQIIN